MSEPSHAPDTASSETAIPRCTPRNAALAVEVVCRHFGFDREALLERHTRAPSTLFARGVLFVLMRDVLHGGLSEIGRLVQRDHTSVMHTCRIARAYHAAHPHAAAEVERCRILLEEAIRDHRDQ